MKDIEKNSNNNEKELKENNLNKDKNKNNNSKKDNINTTMKYNFNMGYSLNKNYVEPEENELFEKNDHNNSNDNIKNIEENKEEKMEKDITEKQMLRNLSIEDVPKRKSVNMGNYTYPYLTDEEKLRRKNINNQSMSNTAKMSETRKYEFNKRLNNDNLVDEKFNTRNLNATSSIPIIDEKEDIEYEVEGYGKKRLKRSFDFQNNSIGKLVAILILIIAILLIPLIVYRNNLKAVDSKNPKQVNVQISEGASGKSIAKKLKDAGVIRNEKAFRTFAKSSFPKFKAGTYSITTDKSAEDIVKMMVNGEVSKNIVNIQLIEGKTFKDLAKIISEKLGIPEDEVIKKGRDKEYLKTLISNYWFLTDEILDDNIYYPLEGYLFPDTYTFDKSNCSVEIVFKEMLKETEKKLKQYNDFKGTKNLGIHQVLTLASVVEKETLPKSDRDLVATIFMNRLSKKMNLGSDVTTYYANNVEMGKRDLRLSEINKKNPYNTRGPNMEGKLPIGPICMPSEESIIAAIDMATAYKPTSDLFFVSDKNGKIYSSSTNREHEEIIAKLRKEGLWYEF